MGQFLTSGPKNLQISVKIGKKRSIFRPFFGGFFTKKFIFWAAAPNRTGCEALTLSLIVWRNKMTWFVAAFGRFFRFKILKSGQISVKIGKKGPFLGHF